MSNKRSLAQLSVWLGQTLVGSITELPNDRNIFVFDETYAENPDRPVLSLSFYGRRGTVGHQSYSDADEGSALLFKSAS